jgi:hypothetical protein
VPQLPECQPLGPENAGASLSGAIESSPYRTPRRLWQAPLASGVQLWPSALRRRGQAMVGRLTDDDLDKIERQSDKLIALLQTVVRRPS